jgi:hypothetical protein
MKTNRLYQYILLEDCWVTATISLYSLPKEFDYTENNKTKYGDKSVDNGHGFQKLFKSLIKIKKGFVATIPYSHDESYYSTLHTHRYGANDHKKREDIIDYDSVPDNNYHICDIELFFDRDFLENSKIWEKEIDPDLYKKYETYLEKQKLFKELQLQENSNLDNNFELLHAFKEKNIYLDLDISNGCLNFEKLNKSESGFDTGEGGFVYYLIITDKNDLFCVCSDDSPYSEYTTDNNHRIIAKIMLGASNITYCCEVESTLLAYDFREYYLNKDGEALLESLKKIYPPEFFTYNFVSYLDT